MYKFNLVEKINADQQSLIAKLTSMTQFKYFNVIERLKSINETDVYHLVSKKRKASELNDENDFIEEVTQVIPSTSATTNKLEFGKSVSNRFNFVKSFDNVVNKGRFNLSMSYKLEGPPFNSRITLLLCRALARRK